MRRIALFVAALSFCQFSYSQSPADIRVVQATYGAEQQRIDVTAAIQSLVQSGNTAVRVGNHLFGNDPAFGKTKTLSVLFVSNGGQYRSDIREGEQLSFSTTTPVQPVIAMQSVPTAVQTPPRLAPEGTYFLIGSTSVIEGGALIGLHAGTVVQALRDNGTTLHVKWKDSELDVDKRILTNDVNIAEAAVANDRQAQAAFASGMAHRQEATNQKARTEQQIALEASARAMEKPREAFGAWSSSQENPLNRRAYNSAGTTSNKEVGQLLESLQPQVTNPLDRGAYNTTAAFSRHTRSSQAGQNSSGSSGSSGGAQSSANPSLERSAEWYQRETQRRFLLEDERADVQARINKLESSDKDYYKNISRLGRQSRHLEDAIDDTYRPLWWGKP